jgi:hypothetical protein
LAVTDVTDNSLSKTDTKHDKSVSVKKSNAGKRPWDKYDNTDFHPKQRIFLSIDAIGSTKLKSSLIEKGSTSDIWATYFLAFLPEVVIAYRNKLVEAINEQCRSACHNPCVKELGKEGESRHKVNVWKYIGDEVVLVAALTCKEHHASLHVLALAETIKQFNSDFADKPILNDPNNLLRFKGTAWVAGFPVANIELILPGPIKDQAVKDFLGPSIDLGFRLSKFASEDRLIISASLAHLIASEPPMKKPIKYMGEKENNLPLCFGGLAEIKGVKDGTHPLIWYSINETAESKLCRANSGNLLTFLKDGPLKNLTIPPFILDARSVDHEYDKEYIKAVEAQKKIPGSIFYPKGKQSITSSARKTTKNSSDLNANNIVKRIPSK